MKLTVKNFGPIKSAKVDVKPLTVFVGPSNTGKSYLAMLIYAVAKVMKAPHEDMIRQLFHEHIDENMVMRAPFLNIFFDEESTKLTDELFLGYLEVIRAHWRIEAMRCFGEEWRNITKRSGDPASITISDDSGKVVMDFFSSKKDKTLPLDSMRNNIRNRVSSSSENEDPHQPARLLNLSNFILLEVSKSLDYLPNILRLDVDYDPTILYRHGGADAHYLPAVRGGIMQSHRILVSTLINNASSVGLTGTRIASFNSVIADFLQKLLMIDRPSYLIDISPRNRREDAYVVSMSSEKIEKEIMRGKIKMSILETGYPDFRYKFTDKGKSRDISLIHASSSVSELAPLVLFIRYYLSPNDIFIVEEPEAHLHPGAQRDVAGILVELVNAGVNVVITTHSDVILEQISNSVHADQIPKGAILKKRTKARTLNEEKARCYSFKSTATRGKGTVVKAVQFDDQTGFLTDDHLDVSSDLYNQTVELLNLKVSDENDRA